MCRVRDHDLSSVLLIARTRAVLYGESWPVANYRFASLSLLGGRQYIFIIQLIVLLCILRRVCRDRALPSPLLASSLRELR